MINQKKRAVSSNKPHNPPTIPPPMAFSRLVFSGDVPLEEEDEAVVDTAGAADDEDACVEVTCTEDVDLVI